MSDKESQPRDDVEPTFEMRCTLSALEHYQDAVIAVSGEVNYDNAGFEAILDDLEDAKKRAFDGDGTTSLELFDSQWVLLYGCLSEYDDSDGRQDTLQNEFPERLQALTSTIEDAVSQHDGYATDT